MHWDHDVDYLHHFEEEETIVDRMQYIHKFYLHRDQVTISHEFNHRGDFYYEKELLEIKDKNRYEFENHFYHNDAKPPPNLWAFDLDLTSNKKYIDLKLVKTKYINNKVVIWRPLHNAEIARSWKRKLTNSDWDVIITKLRQAGLHVVELTYRTPIREAMFHLQTCRLSLSYDGMWHYVARNLCIPMSIVSSSPITKYHTPNSVCAILSHSYRKNPNIWKTVETQKNLANFLGETKKLSMQNKKMVKGFRKFKSLSHMISFWRKPKKGPTLLDKDHRELPKRKKKKK